VPWVETTSPHFAARHELVDDEDVAGLLELLEGTRERLTTAFATIPGDVEVVVHGSDTALAAAQPYLPILRRMVAPAARRYLVGWLAATRSTSSPRGCSSLTPRTSRARAR